MTLTITTKEPWVILDMVGGNVNFLINTKNHLLYLDWSFGPLSSKSCKITGVHKSAKVKFFTLPLNYRIDNQTISHGFLVMSHLSTRLGFFELPGNYFTSPEVRDTHIAGPSHGQTSKPTNKSPCWNTDSSQFICDQGVSEKARDGKPVIASLKDKTKFPPKKQYLLKLEAKQGLQSLIDKFFKHRLILASQSPWNTPILPLKKKKPNGEYYMVQDLRVIKKAVVPIYPIVANPCTILTQIPSDTHWFTLLNLKMLSSAHSCIWTDSFCLLLNGQMPSPMLTNNIPGLYYLTVSETVFICLITPQQNSENWN